MRALFLCLLGICWFNGNAQYLINPSLEGTKGYNRAPSNWNVCEISPDVFPGFAGCENMLPVDSSTYVRLGVDLINNLINNQESIGQQLAKPLQKDSIYRFTGYIAYQYQICFSGKPIDLRLRMYLSNKPCSRAGFFVESQAINTESTWIKFDTTFSPDSTYQYVMLGAFLSNNNVGGRILVDSLSLKLHTVLGLEQNQSKGSELYFKQTDALDRKSKYQLKMDSKD